jgi:hypothetical protein
MLFGLHHITALSPTLSRKSLDPLAILLLMLLKPPLYVMACILTAIAASRNYLRKAVLQAGRLVLGVAGRGGPLGPPAPSLGALCLAGEDTEVVDDPVNGVDRLAALLVGAVAHPALDAY